MTNSDPFFSFKRTYQLSAGFQTAGFELQASMPLREGEDPERIVTELIKIVAEKLPDQVVDTTTLVEAAVRTRERIERENVAPFPQPTKSPENGGQRLSGQAWDDAKEVVSWKKEGPNRNIAPMTGWDSDEAPFWFGDTMYAKRNGERWSGTFLEASEDEDLVGFARWVICQGYNPQYEKDRGRFEKKVAKYKAFVKWVDRNSTPF